MAKLTVLTERVNSRGKFVRNTLRDLIRGQLYRGRQSVRTKKYGGHYAVTRSLIEGLQRVGADFTYNPRWPGEVGETVVVLAGVDALRQAIEWKRRKRIRRLLAGPNLMVFSTEFDGILGSPEIDVCLVPSEWVKVAYEEDLPILKGRIRTWWAGVDENFWKGPSKNERRGRSVLVYKKNAPKDLCASVDRLLRAHNWLPTWVTYGQYSVEEYRDVLSNSYFGIFLSQNESQGIALAEAWSMDMPTLVWNPRQLEYRGRHYSIASACPYLSPATGWDWADEALLASLLSNVQNRIASCEPRRWVLKHMTDEISARLLLEFAGSDLGQIEAKSENHASA